MAEKLWLALRSLRAAHLSVAKLSRPKSTVCLGYIGLNRPSPVVTNYFGRRCSCTQELQEERPDPTLSVNREEVVEDVCVGNSECDKLETEREVAYNENKLFEPFESIDDPTVYETGTFQNLFENSRFVKALDPVGKEVEAEIIAIVEDKLYIDFGCKFHAVVTCPDTHKEKCQKGTKVIIEVKDLEVTKHFIGDNKHQSLLEAEATFIRPIV